MNSPKFRVAILNQTNDWDEKWRKDNRVTKCELVCVFDASSATYCCEMAPSFELHPSYYRFEFESSTDDAVREKAEDESNLEFSEESIIYIHCRSLTFKDSDELLGIDHLTDVEIEDVAQMLRENPL